MNEKDDSNSVRSLYDPGPTPDEDLWFLPASVSEDLALPPGMSPKAQDRRPLIAPGDWARAETQQARGLAGAALAFGALEERTRRQPGLIHRLAVQEAADQSWLLGDRIAPERLALYLAGGMARSGDSARALMRAAWAVRRLQGGPHPAQDLAGFLGRHVVHTPADASLISAPQGAEFQALAADWHAGLTADLHPFTRAGLGWKLWGMLALSGPEPGAEAGVAAARLAAEAGRGGLGFVPVMMGGALPVGGDPQEWLGGWFDSLRRSCLRGLMLADQLADWETRALRATEDLNGRTARALIGMLARWPLVSAPLAERETGQSRAAIQRNLTLLQQRGLTRERSGQARFRFWEAAL